MMAIVSSMLVERTERGDRMFMTLLQRHCKHVLDTDALTTLPDPIAPEPLRPCPDDEAVHAPTDEPLWSESWYADFVDAAHGFGGWFRIGLVANQRVAWVQVLVCGPDLSTVAVLDYQVPSPADPWVIRTDAFDIGHRATEPLRTYRLDVRAQGQAYSDPSALLRGESGTPIGLTMNLLWTTDGMPYQYRVTTRYEIPCTVTGTVTVGDKATGSTPFPDNATTRGVCGTGGAWTGCGARCTSRTAPTCTLWTSTFRTLGRWVSATFRIPAR